MSALNTQVGGDHYKSMPIQPMEYSMVNGLDACQHTAIKYITRFRQKGGIQDLEKAKHVIDMLIEFERKKNSDKGDSPVQAEPLGSCGTCSVCCKFLVGGEVDNHECEEPAHPAPLPTCPDCGAPDGDVHYVLCPRLPVPEEHAKAVEEAFAAEEVVAQFDESRADIIGQNGNDGEHYAVPEGVDIYDWRTWQVGDRLECIETYSDGGAPVDNISLGEIVTILEVEPRDYNRSLPLKVEGADYSGWPDFDDYEQPEGAPLRQLFRFHHRPAKTDE